jgi:hypothetical protein
MHQAAGTVFYEAVLWIGSTVYRIQTRVELLTGRGAHGGGREGVRKLHAFSRKAVDIGCFEVRIAVGAGVPPSLVICQHQHYIRTDRDCDTGLPVNLSA